MHAALGQFSTAEAADFVSEDVLAAACAVDSTVRPSYQPSPYRPPRLSRSAAAVVVAGHALLLLLLASIGTGYVKEEKRAPLVLDVIELPLDPPPEAPPPAGPVPVKPVESQVVAPAPLVPMVRTTPPIQTVSTPPPPAAIVAAPEPTPPAPVAAPDLKTTRLSGKNPTYPLESEKRREQGTVVLLVVVGVSGTVEQISVYKSSGFERLDKAALAAVRKWRWTPGARELKGYVPFPFVMAS